MATCAWAMIWFRTANNRLTATADDNCKTNNASDKRQSVINTSLSLSLWAYRRTTARQIVLNGQAAAQKCCFTMFNVKKSFFCFTRHRDDNEKFSKFAFSARDKQNRELSPFDADKWTFRRCLSVRYDEVKVLMSSIDFEISDKITRIKIVDLVMKFAFISVWASSFTAIEWLMTISIQSQQIIMQRAHAFMSKKQLKIVMSFATICCDLYGVRRTDN